MISSYSIAEAARETASPLCLLWVARVHSIRPWEWHPLCLLCRSFKIHWQLQDQDDVHCSKMSIKTKYQNVQKTTEKQFFRRRRRRDQDSFRSPPQRRFPLSVQERIVLEPKSCHSNCHNSCYPVAPAPEQSLLPGRNRNKTNSVRHGKKLRVISGRHC